MTAALPLDFGTSKECRRCHRVGSRGFTAVGGEGWECTNDRACARRVAAPTSWVRIQRWCRCGDHLDARSSPPAAAIAMDEQFGEVHQGDGHGPTDARGARNARRRAARAAVSAPTTDTEEPGRG